MILIKLQQQKKYQREIYPLILEQLTTSPENQLPTYAEQALVITNNSNRDALLYVLTQRVSSITVDTKLKRLQKVISKLNKLSKISLLSSACLLCASAF